MALKRLAREAKEVWEVPRDLLLGRYPDFVTGGTLPKGHVPVFCFHGLEPESFERKLRHLYDNGYVTLSTDEYFQVLMGTRAAPSKAVVLTFDDARSSVRTVGLPLMKRYGMKGIVFMIPGRTVSRPGPLPPTWENVREGSVPADAVLARESGPDAFLTWEEVLDLTRSGVFDFQSHTLTHGRIHTAPHLVGFMHPGLRRGYAPLDVPLVFADGRDHLAPDVPLGTPLFRSEPRTSESLRFCEDPEVRAACVETVQAEGGEGFFQRADWEKRLRRMLNGRPVAGHVETPENRAAGILRELKASREQIQERTGREVVHLCYPWHVSGPTARRLAREAGYRTAFCGKVPGVTITLPGGDPQAIARIGEDYVELLPGRGRAEIASILRLKWSRRLHGSSRAVPRR